MADNKGNNPQRIFSSLRELADFPEVKDKIINSIELSSDLEFFEITVTFQDKTRLTFIIEPCLVAFPVLADWTGGEEKIIKRYKQVRSKIPRT
ncbi:MAG: hypothetical protein DMG65_16565 [Candidatus Angelobacter sp. Gp1-AA117]|nr:MAG: hypothetical protein DMG65_16565 [Candidatus Angelobacter sp. Gp1-AA117]